MKEGSKMNDKITPRNQPAKLSHFKNKILLLLGLVVSIFLISFAGIRYFSSAKKVVLLAIAPEKIIGSIITLKTLKEEDFIDYHNMFSDIVRKNLEFSQNFSFGQTVFQLKSNLYESVKGELLYYTIFDNKKNKLIGSIEIREKNDSQYPGQLACWINENYWGGGRFQEAIKLITNVFFSLKPQKESYIAHVRLWNKRSHKALLKAGLVDIGFFHENGEPTRHIMKMKNMKY
jgi:RimJ/RimL family protein N-acetyltransferase